MLLSPASAATPLPMVAYGGFWQLPNSMSAQGGVASFVYGRDAYVADLAPLGDGRPVLLYGPAAGNSWRVAAENGIAVASMIGGGGFHVYTKRPEVTVLRDDAITGFDWGWHYDATYARPTPSGKLGGFLAMAGDQVVVSNQYWSGLAYLEVFEFSATGAASHVQTIAPPASLPHWTNPGYNAIQIHGDTMIVTAIGSILHYARSAGQWSLVSTLPTPGISVARADVGDDADGVTRLVYSPDSRNVYVANIDRPLENRSRLPFWGDPVTSVAIDDGIVAVTEGDYWIGRDLRIFTEGDAAWEEAYRPEYTSVGRFYEYNGVDVSDGNIIVKGYDWGTFEPDYWLDFFVVPEAGQARLDQPVPRIWEPKYNGPQPDPNPDLTPIICLNFLSVLHFAADC